MAPNHPNKLAVVSWLTLSLAIVARLFFGLLTPEVALITTTSNRDAKIQSIKAETDIIRLQAEAEYLVAASYGTGTTATFLCRVALFTLLVVIVGSVVSLVQIRRLQRAYSVHL
jgi:hypothetical protein